MKKFYFLFLLAMLPLLASAKFVEIDGFCYYIDLSSETKTALFTHSLDPNKKYSGDIVIPESVTYNEVTYSVTAIDNTTFSDCSELTSVTIPNSVTSIGYQVFINCSGLTSVTIPNSVTSIGNAAFLKCSSLTSVTIPGSVTTIEDLTFERCTSLTSVTINNGVTSIEGYAFKDCTSLTSVTIPNSVTSIGGAAFSGCTSLTSVTIGNSVTSIGNHVFDDCSGLTSIVVEAGNTVYDSRDNCNAIIETESNNLIVGCKNTTIPNSVTSIDSRAFYGCSDLTSVTIPNSVTSIEYQAFLNCSSLTSVTIPSNMALINSYAFDGCSSLTSVTTLATTPPTASDAAFTNYDIPLYVPKGTRDAYLAASPWNKFKEIIEIDESSEGESVAIDPYVIWCEDNTTLYFLGNGDDISNSSYKGHAITQMWHGETVTKMPENSESYAYSPAPWALNNIFPQCTNVVIDESFKNVRVTSTSGWFAGCHMQTIEGIEYLNTSEVTSMSYMFGCPNLTSLDVSHFDTRKVKYMQDLFGGCNKLETIDLSNFDTSNVVDMTMMFRACSALKTLDLSNFNTSKVTNMTMMFSKCDALTNIDLSSFNTSNVTTMNYMFQSCSSLTSLDLTKFNTEKVTEMYGMFYDCSSLTTIDLSHFDTSNVTAMTMMFAGCSGLTSLDVSKFNTSKVTGMGGMFARCTNLTSLDLRSFNTENVTEMDGMFSESSSLTTLDLSSFNTEKLTTMHAMFNDCSNLKTIYVGSKWSMASIIYEYNFEIFLNCTNLVGEQGTTYREDRIDITYAHVDGGSSNPGYFTFKEGGESPAEETEESIKITSAGQTTWCSAYDLDFTNVAGLKAYIAAGYNRTTGTIWLMRVFEVPAKEGILLMGDPGEYKVPHKSTTTYYMNMFKGTLEDITINETDGEYTNYYLSNGDSGVGFYKVNGSIGIKAHRAYLPLLKGTAQAGTRFIGLGFEDDGTTNLTPALSKGEGEGEWFTLQGQRVAKPGKGLYIRNGKKVVIK